MKQFPRKWNIQLHRSLVKVGLRQSAYNPKLYFLINNSKRVVALTVHVDYLAVVGQEVFVNSVIRDLGKRFNIGLNKPLHHFLAINIQRDPSSSYVFLSQPHYISNLQHTFFSPPPLPAHTPTNSNFKNLTHCAESEAKSSGNFHQLNGSLLWVSQSTCPDVAFAVNRLSQFLQDPSESHWQAGI